ncbi:helix-turn-helix domain-containing protein [Streptomyces sp. NPDC020845]|uniref:helix-turn-helix domain-containing protein n=1 Tax=Streptomyces sp. NPDC020845 TaxID=3365096 RepID=UPI0037AEEF9C
MARLVYPGTNQHLADPGLTPATVAAAHHISARHLHRPFQAQEVTMARWTRRHRLEMCHRDLTDPFHNHCSVQAVAARWGLTDKAQCSRAFRTAYGMPPGDLRHLAQGRHGGRGSSTARHPQTTTGRLSRTETGRTGTPTTGFPQ